MIEQRIQQVAQLCQQLAQGSFAFAEDPLTQQFCCTYLRAISYTQLLKKVEHELGIGLWRPLGRVLIVVSEKDLIGTLLATLAAFITANQIVVKARNSQALLAWCKAELKLTNEQLQIADWQSTEQQDAQLLYKIDAVVLAGSLALVQHYRQVVSYPVRLIEYGPKISAAVLTQSDAQTLDQLVQVVSVFAQQVCSSPQFIMLDSTLNVQAMVEQLSTYLVDIYPLNDTAKLAQASHYQQLQLLQRCDQTLLASVFNPCTGWGISLSQGIQPALWFKQGFNLCVGNVQELAEQAAEQWRSDLQTLGVAGPLSWQPSAFLRICPLAAMHQRPLTAAHDGFFELAALVNFYQDERL